MSDSHIKLLAVWIAC